MRASKDGRQVAPPDPDPSIGLAQTARTEVEREFLARHLTVEQLIERAKKKRVELIAALRRRSAVRLKCDSVRRRILQPLSPSMRESLGVSVCEGARRQA